LAQLDLHLDARLDGAPGRVDGRAEPCTLQDPGELLLESVGGVSVTSTSRTLPSSPTRTVAATNPSSFLPLTLTLAVEAPAMT